MKKIAIVCALAILAGCGTGSKYSGKSGKGYSKVNAIAMNKQYGEARQGETIYRFAFDRSELSPADKAEVRRHAKFLAENPNARIRIEGHTDSRGSREYNVALAERRAKTVAGLLFNEGVKRNQIAVVSYGKEKPLALGNDDDAHQLNRRAEIVYEAS